MNSLIHEACGRLPQRLTDKEIMNPFEVIKEYFEDYSMPNSRKYIVEWLESICNEKRWRGKPSFLLYFSDQVEKLIEAAYLIDRMDNHDRASIINIPEGEQEIDLMKPSLFCGRHRYHTAWNYFPRSLSRKEFLNPYRAISRFFKYQNLGEWREELRELLHDGLSDRNALNDGTSIDILKVKKHLEKLIEATHLISVRESPPLKNVW